MQKFVCLALLFLLTPGCQYSRAGAGRSFSEVRDLQGQPVNPFAARPNKAVVLIFVRPDCPISNRYAPEIERLKKRYAPQQVAFWLVYPDPETTPSEISLHLEQFSLSLSPLRDPQHELVRKAAITVTPEAAVFLPDGEEVYRGRIDDRYVDFGKERPGPTKRDLEVVLQNVVAGRPVVRAHTTAVGCYISD